MGMHCPLSKYTLQYTSVQKNIEYISLLFTISYINLLTFLVILIIMRHSVSIL